MTDTTKGPTTDESKRAMDQTRQSPAERSLQSAFDREHQALADGATAPAGGEAINAQPEQPADPDKTYRLPK